jgi:hypothetical protein
LETVYTAKQNKGFYPLSGDKHIRELIQQTRLKSKWNKTFDRIVLGAVGWVVTKNKLT